MRRLTSLLFASQILSAQSSTTVALESSPNPAVFGSPVTLTATVTPASASGPVTFYDGVAILGISQVSNGQATFTTRLLNAGAHTLRAYYGGQTVSASQEVNSVAAGGFQPAVNYAAGNSPQAIAAADFDGNGKTDLAIANGLNGMTILLGNGDGTFSPVGGILNDWEVYSVAVGDFNGDGKPDLVVSSSSGQLGIRLGNGDGTFQRPITLSAEVDPYAIAVIDANGDGIADLAVLDGSATVIVFLGNGDATFQAAKSTPIASASGVMVAGDFNGDGKPDLAVALFGSGEVAVLLGNGDGTFQAPVNYPAGNGYNPASIAVGDFNGDGKTDLVVGLSASGVSVMLGNGDGTFQSPIISGNSINLIPYYGSTLLMGDFNGDGKLDIAANDGYDVDGVTVALGKGDGTFQPPLFYRIGSGVTIGLVAEDFNGHGQVDLAALSPSDNTVGVLLAQTTANPTVSAISVNPSSGVGVSQTFSFQFSDSAGVSDIATVSALFGQSADPGGPICAATYNRQQNTVALWNDDGSLPTGIVPGSGSQANSYCSLDGGASSVILSANVLNLNLAISFKPAGSRHDPTRAEVVSTTGATSGFQTLGGWTAGQPPQAVSVTPSSGAGMAQTFTFVYSDPYGAADFWYVEAEFYAVLQAPPWVFDCAAIVYPGSGALWLGSNSLTLGTPGTLQTNQCAVNVAASSGSMSANAYTLTLSLSFTSAFAGIKTTVDGDAVNGGGVSTSSTLGTWTVPNCTVTFDTTASVSDVQRVINEALGTWSPTDDLNLDGIVNIADVQIVLNAALNLGCS